MNDLISQLTNRVGITQDKAQQAVNVVLSYVKENLPAPVSNQVETLISSGTGNIGGNFGGSQSKSGTNPGNVPPGSPGTYGSGAGKTTQK